MIQDVFNQFRDFKSFEVAFYNQDKELQKLYCTVKSIENNRIVLNANNNTNKNIVASVGEDLQLHIYTENGIYSAKSKVILVSKGLINTEYIISYPANSKHSQRREYFRAEIPLKFNMKVFPSENSDKFFAIDGTTRNVCGKGMSFISDKLFLECEKIEVELAFDEKVVKTSAQLVYSKKIVIQDHSKFIHAFMFTDISKKDIEFIIKKCFLHQLDLRKKSIWD